MCMYVCLRVSNMKMIIYSLSLQNKGDTAVKSANEEVVNEMYYIDFDEVIDDTSLVESLTEFYQDFKYPIYKKKTLPQGAEILNVTRSEGKNHVKVFLKQTIKNVKR